MIVTGAYGREYDTKSAARADWFKGLDFKIFNGPYINKADADMDYNGGVHNPYPIQIWCGPGLYAIVISKETC